MNIIIVAGGLGTRFKELSVIPKLLLPLPNEDSIITHNCKIFENNNITVIINEKFYDMFANYVKVNNLSNINIISTTNCNGSYNTIRSVYNDLPKLDVLFVWSDLVLADKFQKFDTSRNYVITDDNGNYRYKCNGTELSKVENTYDGNVPGLYFIKDLNDIFTTALDAKQNYDLIDAIIDSKIAFNELKLQNTLIECRDLESYITVMHSTAVDTTNKTRFFNSLVLDENKEYLVKTAIDDNYVNIIQNEFNWYKTLDNLQLHAKITPNVQLNMLSERSFKMQYLNGYVTLNEFRKSASINDIRTVYNTIFEYLTELEQHSINVSYETFVADLKKEIIDKIIVRCDKIQHMLCNYNKQDMIDKLNVVYQHFIKQYENKAFINYSFCHGDLNGSNILVNQETLDVKFIDPRGYFGNTTLYGWMPYEVAKLRYSLCGYDDFNTLPYVYTVDEPATADCLSAISKLDSIDYKLLVGVIYVALAGYISQDICKANIAYEYGMSLLENAINMLK